MSKSQNIPALEAQHLWFCLLQVHVQLKWLSTSENSRLEIFVDMVVVFTNFSEHLTLPGFALPYLAVTAFFVMLLTTSQCSVFDRLISCDPDVSNSFGYVWFKLTCRLFQLHSQSLHAKLNLLVFQTATSNDSVNYYIYSADRNECQWKNSQKFIYILVLCMLQHLFR